VRFFFGLLLAKGCGIDTSTAPNPSLWDGRKAALSINPEQSPGFRRGKVEGLIFWQEWNISKSIRRMKGETG